MFELHDICMMMTKVEKSFSHVDLCHINSYVNYYYHGYIIIISTKFLILQ